MCIVQFIFTPLMCLRFNFILCLLVCSSGNNVDLPTCENIGTVHNIDNIVPSTSYSFLTTTADITYSHKW